MDQLLIATKLSIPIIPPDSIHRPRLEQQLQHALEKGQRLVLISAPAGFGKSTLVGSWIKQGKHPPIAWLSLDADDNYPEIFLQYLLAALAEALPPGTLPAFHPSWNEFTDATLRLLLTPLVNELARQALPLLLVFDDYHEISNQLVHNIITFLLKYLPPCVQLVITSRTDPPLPLASLRARQQLTEIRMADLRFDQQEIHTFFHKRWPLPLSEDVLQTITTSIEGWPAGLHLAALVASGQSFIEEGALRATFEDSNGFILEYLAEEVFQHLPATTQQFLLHTSILDRLTHDLCCALMEDVADAPTLSEVLRRNLFLIQHGEQQWYRYHHLFAQFLRTRLEEVMPQQDVVALHIRASTWLMQQGFRYEALNHVVQAEAWEHMLHLLTPLPPLDEIFPSIHIWRRWIGALPDQVLATHPDLYLVKLWGEVLIGDIAVAEKGLDRDDIVFSEQSQGSLHLLEQHLAMFRGQHERNVYEGTRALELLSPQEHPLLWAMGAVNLYSVQTIYISMHNTSPLLEHAWQIASSLGEPMVMLLSAGKLGEIAFFNGKLRLAASWLNKVQHLVTYGYTVGVPFWCRVAAGVAYEQNDLAQAEQIAKQGLELVQLTSRFHNAPILYISLARAHEALNNVDDATIDTLLANGYVIAQRHGRVREGFQIEAHQLRRWLARGDLMRARRWGATNIFDQHNPLTFNEYGLIVAHTYLARACMREEGDLDLVTAMEQTLAVNLAAAGELGHISDHLHFLVLHALLLWDLGRIDEAVTSLSKALVLGAPEGYLRTFLDEGTDLLPLLEHPTVAQAAPTLVAQLRALLAPQALSIPIADSPPELLSPREQEILRLVAAGNSVHELATHLMISVHTARTHLKKIYTKLDAHTRLQAIKHAQERGLL